MPTPDSTPNYIGDLSMRKERDINLLKQVLADVRVRQKKWDSWAGEGLIFSESIFIDSVLHTMRQLMTLESDLLRQSIVEITLIPRPANSWHTASNYMEELCFILNQTLNREETT